MTPLLALALQGFNPDRVRKMLASGSVPTYAVDESKWPLHDVRFVLSDALPPHLSMLPDAPPWLFVRGRLPTDAGVAIVGSRSATRYGLEVAEQLGARLGAAGWPVVSGLALGIDAAAHRGCVDAGGTAVAVLGSGIDRLYPRRNEALGERILDSNGAIVSEFGPGVDPEPWRFPCRNRIISGLSGVVFVVEAADRSGALITANLALAHGREVIAVPGDIRRETSKGCNRLIRDGAHPMVDVDEAIELVEMVLGPAPRQPRRCDRSMALGPLPATMEEVVERSDLPLAEVMLMITDAIGRREVTLAEGVLRPAET